MLIALIAGLRHYDALSQNVMTCMASIRHIQDILKNMHTPR